MLYDGNKSPTLGISTSLGRVHIAAPHSHCLHERADHKGQITREKDSSGGRDRREWIVSNVAKKGAEIWQPQIVLPGLPMGLFFLDFAFKDVRNMKNLLTI